MTKKYIPPSEVESEPNRFTADRVDRHTEGNTFLGITFVILY